MTVISRFAAFAYAEFASMVPVSGSAYTYSYVAFGEIIAWIIGWALIMEYAIGNITVAISWSDYFTGLLESGGIRLPQWIQMDYLTASRGFDEATALMRGGKSFENLSDGLKASYTAWTTSPSIGPFHFVADLPALFIIILITATTKPVTIVAKDGVLYFGCTFENCFGNRPSRLILIQILGCPI